MRRRYALCDGLSEQGFQEAQTFGRDRILGRRQRPPDRGRFGDRLVLDGERFDDDRPFVSGVMKSLGDFRPGDLIFAWSPAVAPARVEMGNASAASPDGGGRIVLLDVHVERVEQNS